MTGGVGHISACRGSPTPTTPTGQACKNTARVTGRAAGARAAVVDHQQLAVLELEHRVRREEAVDVVTERVVRDGARVVVRPVVVGAARDAAIERRQRPLEPAAR